MQERSEATRTRPAIVVPTWLLSARWPLSSLNLLQGEAQHWPQQLGHSGCWGLEARCCGLRGCRLRSQQCSAAGGCLHAALHRSRLSQPVPLASGRALVQLVALHDAVQQVVGCGVQRGAAPLATCLRGVA